MQFLTTLLLYFFEPLPESYKYNKLTLAVIIIGIIASVALKIYLKKNKEDKILRKLFKSLPSKIFTLSILMGVYMLARYERMPYLSMRICNYLIIGTAVYYLIKYVNMYLKAYPRQKAHHEHQIQSNKYLPRKHKRR